MKGARANLFILGEKNTTEVNTLERVFENSGGKYKIATILQEYKFSLDKAQFFPSTITVQT